MMLDEAIQVMVAMVSFGAVVGQEGESLTGQDWFFVDHWIIPLLPAWENLDNTAPRMQILHPNHSGGRQAMLWPASSGSRPGRTLVASNEVMEEGTVPIQQNAEAAMCRREGTESDAMPVSSVPERKDRANPWTSR